MFSVPGSLILRSFPQRQPKYQVNEEQHLKGEGKALKPYYKSALDRLEKDKEREAEKQLERHQEKDQSKDLGLEKEEEETKEPEKHPEKAQEHVLKLERGFGFDRGMGF